MFRRVDLGTVSGYKNYLLFVNITMYYLYTEVYVDNMVILSHYDVVTCMFVFECIP